jgi:hypothetical protein
MMKITHKNTHGDVEAGNKSLLHEQERSQHDLCAAPTEGAKLKITISEDQMEDGRSDNCTAVCTIASSLC